jgi:hypothetical protein
MSVVYWPNVHNHARSYAGYVGYAPIGNKGPRRGGGGRLSPSETTTKWRGYAGYDGYAMLVSSGHSRGHINSSISSLINASSQS